MRHTNEEHQESLSGLDKFALGITNRVGTMACAGIFAIIALISLPGALSSGNALIIVAWIAQTFLQLVLLPVIMVGQNLQTRHATTREDIQFEVNVKTEKEVGEILKLVREAKITKKSHGPKRKASS